MEQGSLERTEPMAQVHLPLEDAFGSFKRFLYGKGYFGTVGFRAQDLGRFEIRDSGVILGSKA